MGMPITIEVVDTISVKELDTIFEYFVDVDERFSTYKDTSEMSRVNDGLDKIYWSKEMITVIELCEQTKNETNGFFDIKHNGTLDPSGLVKGWAVYNAAKKLDAMGKRNYYVEAGGDIQVAGKNESGDDWTIGIRNPFNTTEIIKSITLSGKGVASSGTYIRGQHIYNPFQSDQNIETIKSLTVIGPNVYEADRYATACFAMGEKGINFVENLPDFEGYMVDNTGIATFTSGFKNLTYAHV